MSKSADNAAKELDAVLDALQKSLLEASEEDVVKELRAAGVDPLKAMEVMTFAEGNAIDEHFCRIRERLAQQRADTMRKIKGVAGQLPLSKSEKLDLLKSIYAKNAQTMTTQFRDLTSLDNLGDAELSSMLQQLAALGYFPHADGNGG